MIGIIAAMDVELAGYRKLIQKAESTFIAGKEFILGQLCGKNVVLCLSGIGKVNAAVATAVMASTFTPSLIINTGVAGGLQKLAPLDIVIADKVCQYDMDTSPLGDPLGYISGADRVYFPTDKKVQDLFLSCLPNAALGTIASGDKFVADSILGEFIAKKFDALSCDMESGAIGHTAHLFNIPFIIVRCISDGADEQATMSFTELVEEASKINVAAVTAVLGKL